MKKISSNRFLQAFVGLMIISAALHILILIVHYFFTGDTSLFNFFKIIELDLFFPHFVSDALGNYTASVVVFFVYLFSFFYLTQKSA